MTKTFELSTMSNVTFLLMIFFFEMEIPDTLYNILEYYEWFIIEYTLASVYTKNELFNITIIDNIDILVKHPRCE